MLTCMMLNHVRCGRSMNNLPAFHRMFVSDACREIRFLLLPLSSLPAIQRPPQVYHLRANGPHNNGLDTLFTSLQLLYLFVTEHQKVYTSKLAQILWRVVSQCFSIPPFWGRVVHSSFKYRDIFSTAGKLHLTICYVVGLLFTARCTLVQSAVLRSHVVCLSVCLSVCPSVTLVNCDHKGWNSSKIISLLVSHGCSLFATPTWRVCSKGNTPKFGPKAIHPLLIWALETFDCKLRPNGYI